MGSCSVMSFLGLVSVGVVNSGVPGFLTQAYAPLSLVSQSSVDSVS